MSNTALHGPIAAILQARLLPAVKVGQAVEAYGIAQAFLQGGLSLLEIPLRSPSALAAIELLHKKLPTMLVGAGTIISPDQVQPAIDAGAVFGVTPGFHPAVIRAAQAKNFPIIPGVATAGELEQVWALGCPVAKLFPIEQLGGVAYIQALAGPYQQCGIKVIPMGGVTEANMASYAALPMVGAIGGSWLAPPTLVAQEKWSEITELAERALKLAKATG